MQFQYLIAMYTLHSKKFPCFILINIINLLLILLYFFLGIIWKEKFKVLDLMPFSVVEEQMQYFCKNRFY